MARITYLRSQFAVTCTAIARSWWAASVEGRDTRLHLLSRTFDREAAGSNVTEIQEVGNPFFFAGLMLQRGASATIKRQTMEIETTQGG